MKSNQLSYTLVKDRSGLQSVVSELLEETAVGVDLEADSMFHYREKVCLIQISTWNRNILIDPLSMEDISPLLSMFSDPGIVKIAHGADYDIRSLYRDFNIEVVSLFDTQIAARFLGYMETGLASLLMEKFGVSVEKKYQRKDWSKRPLPASMLAYAVQDACHLLPLSRLLEEELRDKERLNWVKEEFELLCKVRPSTPNNDPLFMKFKGARRLDPRSLALLETILQLREATANRRDYPPFKVLENSKIMEIVKKRPKSEKDLKGLSPWQIKSLGPSILKRIDRAMKLSEDQLPGFPKKVEKPISTKVSRRIKVLKEWREEYAGKLGLDVSLVCTNTQIQSLARAHPLDPEQFRGIDGIRNWQKKLFGREICALLNSIE